MVGTALGETAPEFQLAQQDGSPVSPQLLRGQPAVLVFWTAWCPSCKEEAPHVNELAAKYEPQGVRVVGINIQDSPARLAGGVKDFGIKYGVASDADASVARRYKVVGTPTIVFLDKQGVVQYFGNELPQDYAARLDGLLAKS
ncbi:MAG TPA: TlpA disulfide reductase family protein [Pyrinomonadaceae bacterium]